MLETKMREDEYLRFQDLVRAKSGIELPPVRRNEVERIIERMLRETGAEDATALLQKLSGAEGRSELEEFIAALTIGETYFFRNRPQISALENKVLPELIERRRDQRSLRVWSAGCSSGEEPYSIAILLERLIPDIDDWRILILGTDVNRTALQKAAKGRYGDWSFRRVSQHTRARYFVSKKGRHEIVPRVRDRVTFRYLNLVDDPYPALATNTYSLDLILCRNVLIYFSEPTRRRIVARFHEALVDGGWLIVGHAEPSQQLFSNFETHNLPGTTLYRKAEAKMFFPPSPEAASAPPPPAPEFTYQEASPNEDLIVTGAGRPLPDLRSETPFVDSLKTLAAEANSDPSDARTPYLAAKLCADRRDLETANLWIATALTRDPLFAPAHYLRSLLLEEEGDLQKALKAVRSCVYADATWPLGHFHLAVLLQRTGKIKRAAQLFGYVLRIASQNDPTEVIPESDGVTFGQLHRLAESHRDLLNEPSIDMNQGETGRG